MIMMWWWWWLFYVDGEISPHYYNYINASNNIYLQYDSSE